MSAPRVHVIGTCDTKGAELAYAADRIRSLGVPVVLVDVSTGGSPHGADITAAEVAAHHPEGASAVLGLDDRGKAVTAMALALTRFLASRQDVGGVLGMGGSGNASIVTAAMRALPFGVPKLMVSTLASGNVASFVGASDIMMMHSVADIAGLNAITRQVIGNAAHAMAGMVKHPVPLVRDDRMAVGMTMFGVTTQAVSAIRTRLDFLIEPFVFHATGTGGQCMENLVDSRFLAGVIDITTTEVADFLCGGILPCTVDRFGSVIRTKVPFVGSVGAVDMVNFGAPDTVPERYSGRVVYKHNSSVTLMRTTPEENERIGSFIVDQINRMEGPVRFLLPLKGVSALDRVGGPFFDAEADDALFSTIRAHFKPAANRKLIEIEAHINDDAFADAVAAEFKSIV